MDTEDVPACCDVTAEPVLCYIPPTHYTIIRPDGTSVTVTPEQLAPLLAATFGVLPALVSTPNVASDMDTGKRGAAYRCWREEVGPELAANMEKWDVIADSAWDAAWAAATERAAGVAAGYAAEAGRTADSSFDPRDAGAAGAAAEIAASIRGEG